MEFAGCEQEPASALLDDAPPALDALASMCRAALAACRVALRAVGKCLCRLGLFRSAEVAVAVGVERAVDDAAEPPLLALADSITTNAPPARAIPVFDFEGRAAA